MLPQQPEIRLQIGLSNEALDPPLLPSTDDQIFLTAHEVADLVGSFQSLLYTTASHRGTQTAPRLTEALQGQYALVLDHVEFHSVFFFFRPPRDSDREGFRLTLEQTIAWIARFIEQVKSRRDEGTLDDVSDVVAILTSAFENITQRPAQFGLVQALTVIGQIAAILRIAKRHNRQVVISDGLTPELIPTSDQIVSMIELEGRFKLRRRNKALTVELNVTFRNGRFAHINRSESTFYVAFPGYSEPIPCRYDADQSDTVGRFHVGDALSIQGIAVFWREDAKNGSPQLIKVEKVWTESESAASH